MILYSTKDFKGIEGIKKNKSGNYYVMNSALYAEIVKSKAQDELTHNAVMMLALLCENLSKKLLYKDADDRKDCISGSILDCLTYWRSFDTSKSTNPFAYFTSVATNGAAKTWRKLGKINFPDSIMTSLDNANIHSL